MLISGTSTLTSASGVLTAGADAPLIAANSERNGLSVQVDPGGTGNVYLLLRSGTASATNFDIALAPGGQWDGRLSNVVWLGAVRFFSSGTPKVAVVET